MLLPAEAVSGHLDHLQGQIPVRDGHVTVHQELPETRCKSQEERPLVRFYRILPCREPVKVFLECRVVHVIHDRGLDLDRAVLCDRINDIILKKPLHQGSFRIEPHISGIRAGFVVCKLKSPHQFDMRGNPIYSPAL